MKHRRYQSLEHREIAGILVRFATIVGDDEHPDPWSELVTMFANLFADDDPDFNRTKFIQAATTAAITRVVHKVASDTLGEKFGGMVVDLGPEETDQS